MRWLNALADAASDNAPAARARAHAALVRRITGTLESTRRRDERCLLLRLQLGGFEQIDEASRFEAVSRVVAERLQRRVRADELLARSAAHEFTVVTHSVDVFPPTAGESIARRLVECMVQPCGVEGARIQLRLRIGIASFPDDARDAEGLLLAASRALHGAHRSGEPWRFAARLPGGNGAHAESGEEDEG
ncbi:MAG: diguanylate cyclase [Proteobacteria bacterium]|nr:diguanylate cyclase [Pseudomonadota bacterium]